MAKLIKQKTYEALMARLTILENEMQSMKNTTNKVEKMLGENLEFDARLSKLEKTIGKIEAVTHEIDGEI